MSCPKNEYASAACTASQDLTCTACNIDDCADCDGAGSCTECNPSFFISGGACVAACPDKTFEGTLNGQAACVACHQNCDQCDGPGADDCTDCSQTTCPAGTQPTSVCTGDVNADCEACPSGTFKAIEGGTTCQPCLAACGPGTELVDGCTASADTSSCRACQDGVTFSTTTDALPCSACRASCAVGEYSNVTCSASGDAECVACDAGTFKDTEDLLPCAPCKTSCPQGEGATVACSASTDVTCTPCESGFTKASTAALPCTACATTCLKGFELSGSGSCTPTTGPTCLPCASGEFQPLDNPTEATCVACRTTCAASQELQATCVDGFTDNTCTTCQPGFFSDANDAAPCQACITGCPAGQKLVGECTTSEDRRCEPCDTGTFRAGEGTACTTCRATCPAGSRLNATCTATTDNTCEACPAGTHKAQAAGSCLPCDTDCAAGTTFLSECTAASNLLCRACTVCDATQLQVQECAFRRDTTCLSERALSFVTLTFDGVRASTLAADAGGFEAEIVADFGALLDVAEERLRNITITKTQDSVTATVSILPPQSTYAVAGAIRQTLTVTPTNSAGFNETHFRDSVVGAMASSLLTDARRRRRHSTDLETLKAALLGGYTLVQKTFPAPDGAIEYELRSAAHDTATLQAAAAGISAGDLLAALKTDAGLSALSRVVLGAALDESAWATSHEEAAQLILLRQGTDGTPLALTFADGSEVPLSASSLRNFTNSTEPPVEADNSELWQWIGIGVGAGVGFIFLVILICCAVKHDKQQGGPRKDLIALSPVTRASARPGQGYQPGHGKRPSYAEGMGAMGSPTPASRPQHNWIMPDDDVIKRWSDNAQAALQRDFSNESVVQPHVQKPSHFRQQTQRPGGRRYGGGSQVAPAPPPRRR